MLELEIAATVPNAAGGVANRCFGAFLATDEVVGDEAAAVVDVPQLARKKLAIANIAMDEGFRTMCISFILLSMRRLGIAVMPWLQGRRRKQG